MKKVFEFEKDDVQELTVHSRISMNVDDETISISKVVVDGEIKFIVENADGASFKSDVEIRPEYPWAGAILPVMKLTAKQENVLTKIYEYVIDYGDLTDEVLTEDFKAAYEAETSETQKTCEGILSSLWVKGYITMITRTNSGLRHFHLEPAGIAYLKQMALENEEEA